MTSQLLNPGRGIWTSRSTVLAAITVGHIAAIALAISVRAPQLDDEPQQPIAVSLLTEQHDEPPAVAPRPPEVVAPEVVVPLVHIEFPQDAPPPPITVVASSAPPTSQTPPAPAAPPVSRGDMDAPIMATAVEYVRPPVVLYPAAAKQARASGTAQIRALVGTDGRVREASVERSSGYASLDKAARESVLGALFRPYMHDGIARAALVIVPVDFSLKVRGGRNDKGPPPDRCGKPQHRAHAGGDSCSPDADRAAPQVLTQSIPE